MGISGMELARLMREPSTVVRAEVAGRVAYDYCTGNFSDKERLLAEEIFRALLKDAQKRVRSELSRSLCHSLQVPHDIAMVLAQDELDIAVPMLEFSYALAEEDLVAIVRATRELGKLCAVARRETVSSELSGALMDTRIPEVAHTLLNNRGAVVSEKELLRAWEFLAADESLLEALVHRGGLPITIAEKLMPLVSHVLQASLVKQYKLPAVVVEESVDGAREWATLGVFESQFEERTFTDRDIEALVSQLAEQHRLTSSLVIRALCMGELNFFEAALARMAELPRLNARMLLFDSGSLGFESLYRAAQMPESFLESVRVLLQCALTETAYGRVRRTDFRKRVIERIYSGRFDRTVESMPLVLRMIGDARVQAHA